MEKSLLPEKFNENRTVHAGEDITDDVSGAGKGLL